MGKTTTPINTDYNIVISGGGVVGCLAALALAKHTSFTLLLLEAKPQTTNKHSHIEPSGFDARVIALAAESIQRLASLDVLIDDIVNQLIEKIHVSDRGHIGQVQLSAQDFGLEALGKVVAIAELSDYLLAKVLELSKQKNAKLVYYNPCKLVKIEQHQNHVALELSNGKQVNSQLLLLSDGGNSSSSNLAGIHKSTSDYGQTAIITNVSTQLPHNNVAYERFTSQGPIAFLPMNITTGNNTKSSINTQNSMSVVWCINAAQAEEKLAQPEAHFLQELNALFSNKLGRLSACSQRLSYPLNLIQAEPFIKHRVVCIGNAAQTLHPIAGQGFNLGIRDVYDLLNCIKDYVDPGDFAALNLYQQQRKADKHATVLATNSLVNIFSNQYAPLVIGRNIGLLALNKTQPLKQIFANFAMGER